MHKIQFVGGILMLVSLVCLGCGRGDLPDLGYVEGIVTLDGQPLPNATLTFQPESAGRPSYGRTDEKGWYELIFTAGNEGATLGKHTIAITTLADGDPDADPPIPSSPEKLPSQYNSRTELTREVQPGKNDGDFELSSEGEIIVEGEESEED